jgi:hypothetical protein
MIADADGQLLNDRSRPRQRAVMCRYQCAGMVLKGCAVCRERTARGERSTSRFWSVASSLCSFMLTPACVVPGLPRRE